MMPRICPQRGVALITALLIVALTTIIAGAITSRWHLDLRRTENQLDTEQVFRYQQGLEALAMVALAEDARQSGRNDHRGEAWARPLPLLTVDRGVITGRMVDLDGRFNLNNLLIDDVEQGAQIAIFRRLLSLSGLNPNSVDAVLDWLDSDALPRANGAEDNRYLRSQPAYRAANQPFYHPSELALVAGFDAAQVERLMPYICALPVAGAPTAINVNTALPLLLQALDPAISERAAEVLYQAGRAQWPTITDFKGHPLVAGQLPALTRQIISVDSQHFTVASTIRLDGRVQQYHSLLVQGRDGVIQRSRNAY